MSDTVENTVDRRRKIEKEKKKNWLKRPKAVPQETKFGPKYRWLNLFVIPFLKILFLAYKFSPHVPMDIIRVFLFQILLQKISEPIKTSEKDHSFYNTVSFKKTSLILRFSTPLKLKIICSQNTAKKISQCTNFPAKTFLFGVRKNICTAPFPDAQELLSWSTLKANVSIFLYISLRKIFVSKIEQDFIWWYGRLVEAE